MSSSPQHAERNVDEDGELPANSAEINEDSDDIYTGEKVQLEILKLSLKSVKAVLEKFLEEEYPSKKVAFEKIDDQIIPHLVGRQLKIPSERTLYYLLREPIREAWMKGQTHKRSEKSLQAYQTTLEDLSKYVKTAIKQAHAKFEQTEAQKEELDELEPETLRDRNIRLCSNLHAYKQTLAAAKKQISALETLNAEYVRNTIFTPYDDKNASEEINKLKSNVDDLIHQRDELTKRISQLKVEKSGRKKEAQAELQQAETQQAEQSQHPPQPVVTAGKQYEAGLRTGFISGYKRGRQDYRQCKKSQSARRAQAYLNAVYRRSLINLETDQEETDESDSESDLSLADPDAPSPSPMAPATPAKATELANGDQTPVTYRTRKRHRRSPNSLSPNEGQTKLARQAIEEQTQVMKSLLGKKTKLNIANFSGDKKDKGKHHNGNFCDFIRAFEVLTQDYEPEEKLNALKNNLVGNACNHLCRLDATRINNYAEIVKYFTANFGNPLSRTEIIEKFHNIKMPLNKRFIDWYVMDYHPICNAFRDVMPQPWDECREKCEISTRLTPELRHAIQLFANEPEMDKDVSSNDYISLIQARERVILADPARKPPPGEANQSQQKKKKQKQKKQLRNNFV